MLSENTFRTGIRPLRNLFGALSAIAIVLVLFSPSSRATTPAPESAPQSPVLLRVTANKTTASSITFTWYDTSTTDAKGYQFAIRPGTTAPTCQASSSIFLPISTTWPQTFTATGLSYFTEYAVSVCAVGKTGIFSAPTVLATNVVMTTPPAATNGMYNVKDFGAVGDGETDDTKAIQSALYVAKGLMPNGPQIGVALLPDAMRSQAGVVVFPGPGSYKISETILWPVGIGLQGGGQSGGFATVPQLQQPVAIRWYGPANADMFDTTVTPGLNEAETWMRDLYLDGIHGPNPPANGINYRGRLDSASGINNVWISGASQYCLEVTATGMNASFEHFHFDRCGVAGLYWKLNASSAANFSHGEVNNSGTSGGVGFIIEGRGGAYDTESPPVLFGNFIQANFDNIVVTAGTPFAAGYGAITLMQDSVWSGKQVFHLDLRNIFVTSGVGLAFQDWTSGHPTTVSTLGKYVNLAINNSDLGAVIGIPGLQDHALNMESHITAAYVSAPEPMAKPSTTIRSEGGATSFNSYAGEFVGDVTVTGNVGIGTPPLAAYKLQVIGEPGSTIASFSDGKQSCSIKPSATGSISCSSDERLKKDIRPFSDATALDRLIQLKTVTYAWKNTENGRHTGYIAQDVAKVAPEFVRTEKNGNKQVSYSGFIPWITSGIKELSAKLADHEKRIASLEFRGESSGFRAPAALPRAIHAESEAMKLRTAQLVKENAAKDLQFSEMEAWACSQTPRPSFCK